MTRLPDFRTISFLIAPIVLLLTAGCGTPEKNQTKPADALTKDTVALVQLPTAEDSAVLQAEQRLLQDSSEENFIWYGRRLGYANRMDDAINAFTAGLLMYPESYRLYRFRGHRYISVRDFSLAVMDLEKAAKLARGRKMEIEPDGIPNKLNKPLSNYQFNIYYHLGLAYYLIGDYYRAQNAYLECMKHSNNDDLLVATADWLYMTLRRMNDKPAAEKLLRNVPDQLTVIENDAYARRIQLYKGKMSVDSVMSADPGTKDYALNLATQGYGVANWLYYTGEPVRARQLMEEVVKGKSNYSFGYIAAETDLSRLWK